MNPTAVVLIGLVMVASIAWQLWIYDQFDSGEKEKVINLMVVPALIVGSIVILGVLLHSIFSALESSEGFWGNFWSILGVTFSAIIFAIILLIKSIFGPIVNGWIVSYSIYSLFEHGIFKIWPFMTWVISLIFEFADQTITITYTVIFMLSSIICAGIASLTDIPDWFS